MRKRVTVFALLIVTGLAAWSLARPVRWRVVAAYTTNLRGRTAAQVHNVRLALRALDGTYLQPGDEFSFNRTVGSWSGDRGYVKAPVSYNGDLVPSWGGGVCQASSTLYNAALLAGLEILERHRHQFPPRYVPPGQDAAVAHHNIDLRFRNPYEWPLRIEAQIEGDRVACRVLSPRPLGRQIFVLREIRQVNWPGEVVSTSHSDDPSGVRWRVVNRGAPGVRVAVYREISEKGALKRSLVSEDTYPPMNRLIRGE